MTRSLRTNGVNLLLRSMAKGDRALLDPHVRRVPLEPGQIVTAANAPIEHVYFPEHGIVSFSEVMADGERVGIAILGHEGMCGWPVLLGSRTSPHEVNVATGGNALQIPAEALLDACQRSDALRELLLRFVQAFTSQLGRTIVSNLVDPIERRLARWLLMNHDRLGGDVIELTHQQIGIMLGVRRASVTDALHVLEGDLLIRCRRGSIEIRDRAGLRVVAGEAYGFAEAQYSRLIGPFGKGGSPEEDRPRPQEMQQLVATLRRET